MSHKSWTEQFEAKLLGLSEAQQLSQSTLSLLGFALAEKRITSEEYLQWAMANFRLPRLQDRFFTESPPTQNLYENWASHYNWSAECIPVAEWEGSLIVACLEPPLNFPNHPPCIFVLASLECMTTVWQAMGSQAQASAHTVVANVARPALTPATAPAAETPEGIDLSLATATVATSAAKKDSFSFDDLAIGEDSPSEESHESDGEALISEEEPEVLEGLFDAPTVVKLQAAAAADPVVLEPVKIANPAALTPIENKQTAPTPVKKDKEPVLVATISAPSIPEIGTEEKTVMAPAPKPAAVAGNAAKTIDIPPPPQKTNPAAAPQVIIGGKPGITTATSGNFVLEKWRKKYTPEISQKVTTILTQMKSHFEKTLILSIDDKESMLSAFAWDDAFKEVSDKNVRIPLQTPSIFNIVASTQKPFHGYISINEVNEKFFEDWNFGMIPDHITITPVIVNDQLVGMIVGLAQKSAFNKATLNFAEKVSTEFSKQLTNLKVS